MAITKIQSESLNLADTYDFTGTVTGAGGVNTPNFSYYKSGSSQVISNATVTKITYFNAQSYDTHSAFSSGRFTVPSGQAGKYHFYCDACIGGSQNSDLTQSYIYVYKNGVKTTLRAHFNTNLNGNGRYYQLTLGTTMQLVAGDYIEMFGRADLNAGTVEIRTPESRFGGYKIIE